MIVYSDCIGAATGDVIVSRGNRQPRDSSIAGGKQYGNRSEATRHSCGWQALSACAGWKIVVVYVPDVSLS